MLIHFGSDLVDRFLNLTNGRLPQLFNEDVRNVGFTPDGRQLWVRVADLTSPASVCVTQTHRFFQRMPLLRLTRRTSK